MICFFRVPKLIEAYLGSVLSAQLRTLGLDDPSQTIVLNDVRWRLQSLSDIWEDDELRRTALVAGREEATFYEPNGVRIELRAAVVVAVRNSILEDLTASHPFVTAFQALAPCLRDDQVPQITRAAIEALRPWLTLPAPRQPLLEPTKNLWHQLRERYPRAWYRMHLLALGRRGELPVDPTVLGSTGALHELLPELESDAIGELPPDGAVVVSGYDPRIDPGLLGLLRNMRASKADVLTIASFKWLTRNPEKLYRVMDAVLLMDKSIITGNYIIARDGVMARDPLLRPPHFESEIRAMFQNTRGLTRTHREIMARLVRS
jgi:hypothetical protein